MSAHKASVVRLGHVALAVATGTAMLTPLTALRARTPDGHEAVERSAVLSSTSGQRVAPVERGPRAPGRLANVVAVLAAAALVAARDRLRWYARGLVGPRRRRIGDVGESWRALLLRAPPVAA